MRSSFTSLLAFFSIVPFVAAHGWVSTVTIDGKAYPGNKPKEQQPNPVDSIIRQIATVDPVTSTTDPGLACGDGAQPARLVASANPGSNISFTWASNSGNWFHNVGPVMTYMARCDSGPCSQFYATTAKWFKIAEAGQKVEPGTGQSSNWYQADLTTGKPYSVRLPEDLKAGQYLIRNEPIALQNAQSPGKAEFYPSCTQLDIGGDDDGVPDTTVSFPGAYNENDPGLLVDVYTPGLVYRFPGGPIAKLASANGQGDDNGAGAGPTSSSKVSSPASFSSSSSEQPSSTASGCTCGAPTPTSSSSMPCDHEPSGSTTQGYSQSTGNARRRAFSTLVKRRMLARR
ncbi:glycosyl hydrolase family 61-domain-containing protein [Trametes polyzona]|nr:glycosyl hydrolase family 61-domain-containing protein [Trametes polyzona]